MDKVERSSADFEAILQRAVRDHVREGEIAERGVTMHHPAVDALVDFQEGRLPDEAAAAVRRHLESCAECAEDLERLAPWDPAAPLDEALVPSALRLAAQRRRFEGRLRFSPPRRRFPLPLAAALLTAALGPAFWLGTHWSSPQPEVRIAENPLYVPLRAVEEGPRRSAGEEIRLPLEFDALVLRLATADFEPHDGYRAEMVREEGPVIRRWSNLARQPNGSFLVTIPRDELRGGLYTVRLLAIDGEEVSPLAAFVFRFHPGLPER
jgi:hypothetical protein